MENIIKKIIRSYNAGRRYLFKDTKYLFFYIYRYFTDNYHNKCKFYTDEEFANLIKAGKPALRLGDGEISLVHFLPTPSNSPQVYSDAIRNDFLKIIKNYSDDSKYIIGIPKAVNFTNAELKKINRFEVCRQMKITYEMIFNKNAKYFDAFAFYKDGGFEKFILPHIKNKKVIIATNEENKKKIMDSKLSSKEYLYVTCGEKNTYEDRFRMQNEIINIIDKSGLPKDNFAILMSAGLSKTIIHDMAGKGYQLIDIGRGLENYYAGISIEHLLTDKLY
ncbi:MAG: GT-D fold domain-containing glycosyltransferase [Candidatus Staskawiczbacteria bacterium]|nr:GT-D fold domain-containing glycosyltransferase [Candidatus Staskawiczbacteria bacterium]